MLSRAVSSQRELVPAVPAPEDTSLRKSRELLAPGLDGQRANCQLARAVSSKLLLLFRAAPGAPVCQPWPTLSRIELRMTVFA